MQMTAYYMQGAYMQVKYSHISCRISCQKFCIEYAAYCRIPSHIVFHKLPIQFQQELVRKLNNNFPSLKDIIENYVDVINLRPPKANLSESEKSHVPSIAFRSTTAGSKRDYSGQRAKYDSSRDVPKFCKFCATPGHTMLNCQRYVSRNDRARRCQELKMSTRCTSQRHSAAECTKPLDYPCVHCNSSNHISALCDKSQNKVTSNFCVNSSDSGKTFLLPLISVEIGAGKSKTRVRCLLDTGSQRSYLSTSVMERLKVKLENKTNLLVNTFIDNDSRSFYEIAVTVDLGQRKFSIPVLINDSFDLSLNIVGLAQCHANVSRKYKLQEHLTSDEVTMEGLLGVDVLQCLGKFELISCLGGATFDLPSGVVPFGNVDSFLPLYQPTPQ